MPKLGRPQIGHTRKVSLTLDADTWNYLEKHQQLNDCSFSETVRTMLAITRGVDSLTHQQHDTSFSNRLQIMLDQEAARQAEYDNFEKDEW